MGPTSKDRGQGREGERKGNRRRGEGKGRGREGEEKGREGEEKGKGRRKGRGREGEEKRPVFWFCVVGNPIWALAAAAPSRLEFCGCCCIFNVDFTGNFCCDFYFISWILQ